MMKWKMAGDALELFKQAGIDSSFASRVDIRLGQLAIKKGDPVLTRSRKHLENLPAFGSVRAALITAGAII